MVKIRGKKVFSVLAVPWGGCCRDGLECALWDHQLCSAGGTRLCPNTVCQQFEWKPHSFGDQLTTAHQGKETEKGAPD